MASATAEIIWIESLLSELKVNTTRKSVIWCDNLSAVMLTANPILHSGTKYMELDLYFVRDQVINGKMNINHLPATYQCADILTKPLSSKNIARLRRDLKVDGFEDITERNQCDNHDGGQALPSVRGVFPAAE